LELFDFVDAKLIRTSVEELGELRHVAKVTIDGDLGVVAALQLIQHEFA
jgi:hypothetical protein